MARMRSGIEIPIIPEDFIDSEQELDLDMMESYLQWAYHCLQDGLDPADWKATETIVDKRPKSQ
jgi:hypothetical protein